MRRRLILVTILMLLSHWASADFIRLPFDHLPKRYPGYEIAPSVYGKLQVFYYTGDKQIPLPGVDAETFKIDQQADNYGLDSKRVYYQGIELPGADPVSFKLLFVDGTSSDYCNREYSRDNAHVYRRKYLMDGADPNTFTRVTRDCSYTKDKNHVYTNYSGVDMIAGADPATFRMVEKSNNIARDKNAVYVSGRRINGAHPASFRLLDNGYTQDSQHVFYDDKIVTGADLKSFRIVNMYYAKDRKAVYLKGVPLAIADAATFRSASSKEYERYACDKNHTYDREGPKKTESEHSPCQQQGTP